MRQSGGTVRKRNATVRAGSRSKREVDLKLFPLREPYDPLILKKKEELFVNSKKTLVNLRAAHPIVW